MPRRYITVAEQQQIIERANRRCEYCKSAMDLIGDRQHQASWFLTQKWQDCGSTITSLTY